nr:retrovirus-related Pol polyprotein from transposon TNT 1-94 [Tanacetum cinerariifolium]
MKFHTTLFDILKQYQNEVNEIHVERLARNANPLALVATSQANQDPYYQTSRSHKSHTPSSKPSIPTRSYTTTRHKGKEIAKLIIPPSETAFEEDIDPEQAQRDKDMQKTLALIANSKNKNVDTTPRLVVQQSGIQCFNYKEFGHFAKECRKAKRVKDFAYHKEKMLLCKQAEQGVPLQAEQYDWLEDTDKEVDEQELEAHYSYMAKIQELPTADSGIDAEPVEHIQMQLKKANTTLTQELKKCKAILAKTSKSLGESISVWDSCLVALQTKQTEFEKYMAFNDRTIDYDKLEQIVDNAWSKHLKDQFRAPTAQDMEILIQTCLMPLAIKTQNDSFRFVHELKQEKHANLKYVESLEKEIDELESDKAEFPDMYDVILQECVSKDVMCSCLQSLSDLDVLDELQCLYLHKVKECDCLAQKLSKQTELVSKKVHTELLQRFANVEKHSISLEIALQKCKEHVTNDTVCNEKASNVLLKGTELKKLIEKGKGKSMDTKFDKPSVIRQPNAQLFPKPSVLGVNHKPNVSRPQLKSNQSRDKVLPNNSQVKVKKTQEEVHPMIPSISNKMKSVTTCKDNVNSRTLNANAICATCNKCLVDSNHFAYVTKMLNDVHARTKMPTVVPISTRKPKSQANKSVATSQKEKVASKPTSQKPQSYLRVLYENTNKAWIWWIERKKKSTCFVRDLQGNDLLTGNCGSNLYTIYLQESTSSTPLCLMAKATPTQAWLWHRRLSHLNFDYINLLSKKDIVIGLPKLKYVKDQLCSSCELSKAKRSSFKSKVVPSSKGRLNLLHMDLCGPLRIASINGKKYILVIVDDYSRYTWTLFFYSKDETPEGLKEFLTMIQRNLQVLVINVRTDGGYSTQSKGYRIYNMRTRMIVESIHIRFDEIKEVSETSVANNTSGLVPQQQKVSDYENPDPFPQRQDVSSSADAVVRSQQELDLLFGPSYDEFFNAGSNLQDKQPSTNIQPTSAPSTPTNVNVEENNNDQEEEREQL